MPCNYKNYPKDWKTRIRPDILWRAQNKCEFCNVGNGWSICRGVSIFDEPVYGTQAGPKGDGAVYRAETSEFLYYDECNMMGVYADKEIKVVLTIAHLDHNTKNNDYTNLKALCQRCHNRHDIAHRKETKRLFKSLKSPEIF